MSGRTAAPTLPLPVRRQLFERLVRMELTRIAGQGCAAIGDQPKTARVEDRRVRVESPPR